MSHDDNSAANEDAERLRRLRERTAAYIAEYEEKRGGDTPPGFLASPLRRWRRAEGLARAEFAAALGGDAEALERLALCRPPRPKRFAEDAAALAAHCGLDPDRLLSLLRRMQVLAAFSEAETAPVAASGARTAYHSGAQGLLLAARDREEDGETTDNDEENPPSQDAPR